jgi:uncharacterized protein with von Willebrand factor type A (vWA) domain
MNAEPLQTLLDSQEVATESTLDKIQPTTELKLDLWGLRQGESLLQESLKLQQLALNKEEVADLHGLAFLPSLEFHAQTQDPIRRQFMEQLLQSIEFQLLKDSTRLNLIASQIAATAFGSELHHLKTKLLGNTATKDGGGGIIPCITSTAKAAKAASKEVGDFTQVCEVFGLGKGKPGEVVDATELKLLFERFQANPTLRQISRLAGSYRKVAEGIHRTQTRDGFDDFAGVILGNELSRILPMELLRIALPELELDFLRRFAEGQLQLRDFESNDPAGLGPVVVVVDESGSMNGAKIEHSKAIALTFAWLSRCQKRWCGLVSFSGGTGRSVLAIPPDSSKTKELLGWAISFIGGGSDQDLPVSEMPAIFAEIGAPEGKTDLIYISDAQLRINTKHAEAFLEWKASVRATLTSLVIGSEPGDLTTISDKVHLFEMLSPALIGSEQVFSI